MGLHSYQVQKWAELNTDAISVPHSGYLGGEGDFWGVGDVPVFDLDGGPTGVFSANSPSAHLRSHCFPC